MNQSSKAHSTLDTCTDDAISREAVRKILAKYCLGESRLAEELNELLPVTQKSREWIPMTTRQMTEEEKERYWEQLEYVDDAVIFNCPLPDDGQEVLITVYGETELDTFCNDNIDGCYFENRDIEDVRAWMPLPEPYEPQESEENK